MRTTGSESVPDTVDMHAAQTRTHERDVSNRIIGIEILAHVRP